MPAIAIALAVVAHARFAPVAAHARFTSVLARLAGRLLAVLALAFAVLVTAVPVLADTATPPPPAAESNNLLLAIVALGVLTAVVVIARPRKPSG